MGRIVTCIDETLYWRALTRGKQYEVIEEKNSQLRLRGDNGRTRWYSALCFDLEGKHVPLLERWKFDNPEDIEAGRMTEVTMQFDDGKYRWSLIATPSTLKELLEDRDTEPGIWALHMIVMRSFNPADVSMVLSELDRGGELIKASRPIDFQEGDGPDEDGVSYDWQLRNPRPERRYMVAKQSRASAAHEVEQHEG